MNIFLLFNCTDAPRNVVATVTSLNVSEGQTLTFSCSARGRPYPTFKWFHNGLQISTLANWTIPYIKYSQAGTYCCRAQNTHGTEKSPTSQINVFCKSIRYWPQYGISLNVLPYYLFLLIVKSDISIKKEHSSPRFLDRLLLR